MFAIPLALSLVGLSLGPALVALGRKQTLLFVTLEGLTLGLVPALLLFRLLPHLYEESGPLAIVLLMLGYGLFWLVEQRSHRTGAYLQRTVVVPAMALHSLLDGGSLALASATDYGPASTMLVGALVLHRLPEGLLLATTLTPEIGFRSMLRNVAAVGAATVIGALGGHALLESAPHAALHGFVAFGLGVMLRLVVHRHAPPPTRPLHRALGGIGFLTGIVILPLVGSPEDIFLRAQPRELAIFESLGPLFVESAPALLIGLAVAALVGALFPGGAFSGLPLAACSRGVLPVTTRLLDAGVAPAATLALLIAAPQLDPVAGALSLRLLGGPSTLPRVGAGLLITMTVISVTIAASRRAQRPLHDEAAPSSLGARLRRAPGDSLRFLCDHVAASYVLGLLVAAGLEAVLPADSLAGLGAPLGVLLGALLALPVPGCPLATILPMMVVLHKGAPAGAAVSFLVIASSSSWVVLAMLRGHLGLRATVIFGTAMLALAIAAGLATTAVFPRDGPPDLHGLAARHHDALDWAVVVVTGALLILSVLYAGPRAWLGARAGGCDHEPHAHPRPH